MKTLHGLIGAAAGLLLAASPAFAACDVTFADNVQTTFTKKCVACHNDKSPGSGLSLQKGSSIANLVNVPSTELATMPRVTPGEPEASYLYLKLTDAHLAAGGSGKKMPLSGKLKDEDIANILNWIADCAAAE